MDCPSAKVYSDDLLVKDALQLYFSKYHFENGGYELKWFRIKVGRIYIPLPNTKDRVKAVKIHDIHHLITEYEANLRGEAQIGAWELASGCGSYYVAWILNAGSFFYGMFALPRPLFEAFLRGRRARTNFYYNTVYDEALLNKTVGTLRRIAESDSPIRNRGWDYIIFGLWCAGILGINSLAVAAICLIAGRWI